MQKQEEHCTKSDFLMLTGDRVGLNLPTYKTMVSKSLAFLFQSEPFDLLLFVLPSSPSPPPPPVLLSESMICV